MKTWKALAWLMAIGGATMACRALIGLERPEEQQPPPEPTVDAGQDAPTPRCEVLPLPAPPDIPATADDSVQFLAVNGIYLDGFGKSFLNGALQGGIAAANLDCSNTCGDAGAGTPTEVRPTCLNPLAGAERPYSCDLPGTPGMENAMFDAYGLVQVQNDAGITVSATFGEGTAVVGIAGYNGLADDSRVDVAVAGSSGLKRSGDGCRGIDAGPDEDGGSDASVKLFRPREDGCDEWEVSSSELSTKSATTDIGYARGLAKSYRGYVKDNYLVVPSIPVGTLPLSGGGFGVAFTRGFLVARLAWFDASGAPCTPGGGNAGTCLLGIDEGLVAGVVPFRSALETFMASRPLSPSSPLPRYCEIPEDVYRRELVDPLCRARDMTLDPATWFKGAPCDAVSLAARFRARAAKPWVVKDTGVKVIYETLCPDGGAQLDRLASCALDGGAR